MTFAVFAPTIAVDGASGHEQQRTPFDDGGFKNIAVYETL